MKTFLACMILFVETMYSQAPAPAPPAASTSVESYGATILNTNFTLPIARFNLFKETDENAALAKVSFFNSIGAGFGFSSGTITELKDSNGDTIETKFKNTFGMHLGALFARDENDNVVAPILTLSVLDFQLGVGYELGTIETGQRRPFITLAYSIPLHKLMDTNFYILLADKENRSNTFSKSLY